MNRIESVDTASSAAAKAAAAAAPSLTGIALWLGNKDISFWMGVAGIAFICLQAAHLIWKWRRDIRRDRAGLGD
jgi:hypothetical protein